MSEGRAATDVILTLGDYILQETISMLRRITMAQFIVDDQTGEELAVTASFICENPEKTTPTERSMRFFLANCPKSNQLCSQFSGAWVAAATVCNQRLF